MRPIKIIKEGLILTGLIAYSLSMLGMILSLPLSIVIFIFKWGGSGLQASTAAWETLVILFYMLMVAIFGLILNKIFGFDSL